ncbi:MAG: hypothetical protein H0X72_01295 [Acidobacteria bacterium]|jgi:hypothetical protein|nr:hypothetical protein [Acidobacteriota bacterium]
MNSKVWIRKALSMCLVVATIATYSMVALAGSERVAGELSVSGKIVNGETPFVKVNGEAAQSGRSIFSSSTIATPENVSATVNIGRVGKIELAPNTTLALSFDERGINGDLLAGRVTVLNSSDTVNIKTLDGTIAKLSTGNSAAATGKVQDDDDSDNDGGSAVLIWAVILGGAAVGIIIATTTDNNRIAVGSNTIVVSPTR